MNTQSRHSVPGKYSRRAAFTMIEIALSLAVIAFALVAIIGVLPMGMNVQRENREETLLNQDGQYFLEAIRNGARGLDHLTNFVESVTIENEDGTESHLNPLFPNAQPPQPVRNPLITFDDLTNGERIVSLLTTLKLRGDRTNKVTAVVHSLNDSAVLQGQTTRDMSFAYRLISEIVPFSVGTYADVETNYLASGLTASEVNERSNRWREVRQLASSTNDVAANLYDVRLTCRWPLLGDGTVGSRRLQFRTLVAARIENNLFQAQEFKKK